MVSTTTGNTRRWFDSLLIVTCCLPVLLPFGCRGPLSENKEPVVIVTPLPEKAPADVSTSAILTVMSLNVAHGRSDERHQLLRSKQALVSHLDGIASLFIRERPDIAGLQEADGKSFWSGSFNHVEYIAKKANYHSYVRASNVSSAKLEYGTAFISQIPMEDTVAHTFKAKFMSFPKGFIKTTIRLEGMPDVPVDLVSVHLDFLWNRTRIRQINEIIETLKDNRNPLIIMGDFNCEFTGKDSALPTLCTALNLKPYQPEMKDITFFFWKTRYDWIFISDGLEFIEYRTLPDVVSDHQPVLARIKIMRPAAQMIEPERDDNP
ncbi:MAG: endonuclease/exonuclease/phosphatase family protein [Planctomycetota bacterium]